MISTFIAVLIAGTLNLSVPFNKDAEASPLYNSVPYFENKRK